MTCVDYGALSKDDTLRLDRIDTALKNLSAGGVDVAKAISLIAISINESGVLWTRPRADAAYVNGSFCSDCRVIVGYEAGRGGALALRQSILADSDAMAYLQGRNGVDSSGRFLQAPFFHGLDGNGLDCPELARFFEWVVDNRKGNLLDAFSLGPCQQYMMYCGVYAPSGGGQPTVKTGYPQTWDDLWALYNPPDDVHLADMITYLDPSATAQADYPANHPDDTEANVAWLLYQTGGDVNNPNGFPSTYYETGGQPQTMYNGWLWRVINRAHTLGLTWTQV